MTETIRSMAEMQTYAEQFIQTLSARDDQATIIGLSGDLGSGKTTFSQAVARILGIEETVTSPTFVIEKIYKIKNTLVFTRFIHIDAYRLESGKELEKLGFNDIAADPQNLIFIEWPEKVADFLESYTVKTLTFTFIDEKTREITRE